MAQRQKEELSRERFVEVFGASIIDQWGIDWEMLGDDSRAFDDPAKRLNINRILSKMDKIRSHANPDFYRLYGESFMIKRDMDTTLKYSQEYTGLCRYPDGAARSHY